MAIFDKNKFRTVKQQWETPEYLFNHLNKEFNFDMDLAGDKSNAKCKRYFSKKDNALDKVWKGICWLNPPYGSTTSKLKDWVKKAFTETRKDDCKVVMLIPSKTNTNWWHDFCMKSEEIRLIKGRPKFKGCKHGLPFPLAIVIFSNCKSTTKFTTLDISRLTI